MFHFNSVYPISIPTDKHEEPFKYTVKYSGRFYGKYWQLAASAFTVKFSGDPSNLCRNYLDGWGKDVQA